MTARTGVRSTHEPVWFRGRLVMPLRALLQLVLLWPVVAWFCHPRFVARPARSRGPVVFVANHSSHADTAVILRSLLLWTRLRTHAAAAEDHFWRVPALGAFVSLVIGAFPFPRRGKTGLERAEALLARGRNVLMYPEGTRSIDGDVGEFHCGVGVLAEEGATIVPVGLAGTGEILGKGSVRPRSAPVAVVFGDPVRYEGDAKRAAQAARRDVIELKRRAEALRTLETPTTFTRLRRLAGSRAAVALMFAWAVAEAIAWPIIPEFMLVPLLLAAPRRWLALTAAAVAGSVMGGVVAFGLGGTAAGADLLAHAPFTTDRMVVTAGKSLDTGVAGLMDQPLSGIPYKLFALQAGPAGLDLLPFAGMSALVRGSRFVVVALVAATLGRLLLPVWERFVGRFLVLYSILFAAGLARVVVSWGQPA